MKATESQDGKFRLDLPVFFRIGRSEILDVVCVLIARNSEEPDDTQPATIHQSLIKCFRSRAGLIKALKDEYRDGLSDRSPYWQETYRNVNQLSVVQQAGEIVDRLFPELKD